MKNPRVFSTENVRKYSLFFLTVFILFVYLAFPTKDFYWDGIIYAQFIEDSRNFGAHLLHPNHLLYNVFGYVSFQTARNFGFEEIRALFVLQFLTIIFSAASAVIFFKILQLAFKSIYLSFFVTAIFAFSAAWWRFSTDAAVYPISVFFLLSAFYFLLPNREKSRPLIVAMLHTLAMLFHELAVLFFPVAVLGLYFQTASSEKQKRVFVVFEYAVAAFFLTFGAYCLSYFLIAGNFEIKPFFAWTTSFALDAEVSWSFAKSLSLTFRGNRQLFFDGSSRHFERNIYTIFLLVIFGASALILLYQSLRNFREIGGWRQIFSKQNFFRKPLVLLCAAWTIPYLIFLFVFIPGNTFYRLFYFPAVMIFVAALIAPAKKALETRRRRLALLALVIGLYNFLFYIYPNAKVRENTPLAVALQANKIWNSRKILVFHEPNAATAALDALDTNNRLVKYFNPQVTWKPLNFTSIEEIENEIRLTNSDGAAEIWLDSAALEKIAAIPQGAAWLAENSLPAELNLPAQRMKYARIVLKSAK